MYYSKKSTALGSYLVLALCAIFWALPIKVEAKPQKNNKPQEEGEIIISSADLRICRVQEVTIIGSKVMEIMFLVESEKKIQIQKYPVEAGFFKGQLLLGVHIKGEWLIFKAFNVGQSQKLHGKEEVLAAAGL